MRKKKECEQQLYARSLIARQLLALQEALAQDTQLIECAIALNGSHTFTLTTPSRQRAQECVAILGKKQLFGTLTITSLKTVKSDDKSHVLVTLKGQSTQNPT